MIGRLIIAACAALAVCCAARAQSAEPSCTWEAADYVRLEALVRADEDDVGRCIRTYGELNGYTLGLRRRRGIDNTAHYAIYVRFADQAQRQAFDDRPSNRRVLGVLGHNGAAFVTITDTR
jgi:hypothetical protein